MEKKVKSKETDFDKEKPISNSAFDIDESDCFSYLWDLDTRECSTCSDSLLCGVLFAERLKERKKNISAQKKQTIDEVKTISKKEIVDLVELIRHYDSISEPLSSQEVIDYFKEKMKCDENKIVIEAIKAFIANTPEIYSAQKLFRHITVTPK